MDPISLPEAPRTIPRPAHAPVRIGIGTRSKYKYSVLCIETSTPQTSHCLPGPAEHILGYLIVTLANSCIFLRSIRAPSFALASRASVVVATIVLPLCLPGLLRQAHCHQPHSFGVLVAHPSRRDCSQPPLETLSRNPRQSQRLTYRTKREREIAVAALRVACPISQGSRRRRHLIFTQAVPPAT